MSQEKPQGHGRRQVLRAAGAVGLAAIVLPQSWTKPVLRAVVVPAHAQTTPGTDDGPPTTTTTVTTSFTTVTLPTTGMRDWDNSQSRSKLAMMIDSLGVMKS